VCATHHTPNPSPTPHAHKTLPQRKHVSIGIRGVGDEAGIFGAQWKMHRDQGPLVPRVTTDPIPICIFIINSLRKEREERERRRGEEREAHSITL